MSSHPRVFVWCLVLALTQASCMERHLAKKNSNPVIPKVPNKPAAASKADSKLDQGLLALAQSYRQSGDKDINQTAGGQGLVLQDGKVKVDITLDKKESLAAVKAKLAPLGVEVITDLENHLFALVPVASIDKLAALDEVWSMAASRPVTGPAHF
jgi:hypothetical protein